MFLSPDTLSSDNWAGRAIVAGVDLAIDFATLGEYRVVTDANVSTLVDDAASGREWAAGIEWSAPECTRAACSLPRARNREWARSRVHG